MNNLQRTQVVDKNNKVTHVHKRVDPASPAGKRGNDVGVTPSVPAPINTGPVPIPNIGESVQLAGYDFENSEIFVNEVIGETGDVMHEYNDQFDYAEYRAPYLAGEDGITAVATRKLPSDVYNYDIELSMFDGNTGEYNTVTLKDFSTGLGWTEAPSVGVIMSTYAADAFIAEQHPLTDDGVREFASEFGYEPEESYYENEDGEFVDQDPWGKTRNTLKAIHEQTEDLKKLLGDVRYGDYVFGRYKAEYGYDSGIKYAPES